MRIVTKYSLLSPELIAAIIAEKKELHLGRSLGLQLRIGNWELLRFPTCPEPNPATAKSVLRYHRGNGAQFSNLPTDSVSDFSCRGCRSSARGHGDCQCTQRFWRARISSRSDSRRPGRGNRQ